MNENLLDWLETDDLDIYGEAMDGEYGESMDGGEDYDVEAFDESDDAESRASRRRARARRAAQARRRRQAVMAQRRANLRRWGASTPHRAPAPTSAGRELQMAKEGIEKVDLDNKVQSDVFSRALRNQQGRIGRNEHALAASKVLDVLKERAPDLFQDELIKTALPILPLALLQPGTKGISNPLVWSAIAAAGIAIFARTRQQTLVVKMTTPQATIPSGATDARLGAFVADKNGQPVIPQPVITWSSLNTSVAIVDSTGKVTKVTGAATGQTAIFTATAAGAQAGVSVVTMG